jgi:hypothetical protein
VILVIYHQNSLLDHLHRVKVVRIAHFSCRTCRRTDGKKPHCEADFHGISHFVTTILYITRSSRNFLHTIGSYNDIHCFAKVLARDESDASVCSGFKRFWFWDWLVRTGVNLRYAHTSRPRAIRGPPPICTRHCDQ